MYLETDPPARMRSFGLITWTSSRVRCGGNLITVRSSSNNASTSPRGSRRYWETVPSTPAGKGPLSGPMQPDRRFFFHFCILFLVRPILRPSIRMHRFHPNAYRTFFPKQTTEMPVSCVPTDAVYFGIEVNRAVDQESKRHSGNGIHAERK
jgi:hypothetical protein